MAFSCSGGNGSVRVGTANSYGGVLAWITQNCGCNVAGTNSMFWSEGLLAEKRLYLDQGYMNHSSGLNFCGATSGSPSTSC